MKKTQMTKTDQYRYLGKNNPSFVKCLKLFLIYPSYRYIKLLRATAYYSDINHVLYYFYRMRLYHSSIKYGYQINPNAKIGKGLFIGHRGSVIINGKAKLGNNINLAPGCTIGEEVRGRKEGAPTIGNEVWIGTNAVVCGKITIGNNVLIAPNSYVNFDIPSDSIVIGNPAKIISCATATHGYIQNPYKE